MIKLSETGKKLYLQFCIIGAGANGSHFYRSLCQDLATYRNGTHDSRFFFQHIMLIDGDTVEKKNLSNQLYDEEDVYVRTKKVHSLAERYGEHYGVTTYSYPDYIKDAVQLKDLIIIPNDYNKESVLFVPIIIGMLDNNKTRRILHELFVEDTFKDLIYMDLGVEGVSADGNAESSGFGGQCVIGLKVNNFTVLDPVGTVFPNVFEEDGIPMPGCGVVIQSNPQRVATNKFAAQIANNAINNILYNGSIPFHVVNFDARVCGSKPEFISKEQLARFNYALGEDGSHE